MTGWAQHLVPASWRTPSLRRNVLMNWVSTAANVGLSFLLLPVVVRALDVELYGVWTFLSGLAAYSNLLYLGLGAAFMKYVSEARGREDAAGVNRLLGVSCVLYMALGGVCLLVSVAVSPWIPHLFAEPLSDAASRSTSITVFLIGVRLFVTFVSSAFSALLAAHGRIDLLAASSTLAACLRTAAVVLAVRLPSPLVALAGVMVLEAVWQFGALFLLSRAVAPRVRVGLVRPTKKDLRQLYGFGLQAFFVQVAILLIAYSDTALVGVMLGAASVTLYSLPLQLVQYAGVAVSGVTLTLLPELSSSIARGDTRRVKDIYLRAGRLCAALAAFITVHLVLLGPAFLAVWVGPEFSVGAGSILLFLGISMLVNSVTTQILSPFYQAMDHLKVLVFILLAEAAANIILSIWLVQTMGLSGVALGTAVPACLITAVLAPRFMLPRIGVRPAEFARQVLAPAVLLAASALATQVAFTTWAGGADSYMMLIARVSCSTIVAVPVVVATFPRSEWLPLVRPVLATVTRGARGV